MEQLVSMSADIDEALLKELRPKIQGETLEGRDLEKAFTLLGQVCNNTDEIQYEMSDMTQTFQFNVDENIYVVVFDGGACEVYSGARSTPTVVFTIAVQTVLDIMTGKIHSSVAQMNGDINYTGPRHDAIAFQRIFELILDEFI